ncbi:zinc finger protein 544-like [Armigeres subalbatus]|uniref:zinc finger protein 544-like n=1 Tax=Armigeres subalbatus TaxID=124917 RepID=UPI002ED1447C
MDQSCVPIVDFWTSFRPIVPYTPSPDSYYHKPEPVEENPSYSDIEAFYDSVANGSGPPCYKQDYPFSWELQSHIPSCSYVPTTDDGPLDQNNNNNNYCELKSYQPSDHFSQLDLREPVAQEVIVHTEYSSPLCNLEQKTEQSSSQESSPETDCISVMEKPIKIKQECPEYIKQEYSDCVKQEYQECWKQEYPKSVEQEYPVYVKQETPDFAEQGFPLEIVETVFSKKTSSAKLPMQKRISAKYTNPTGVYACPLCDRTFSGKGGLTQHYNAHHSGPKEQRCGTCGKRFCLLEDLEKHQRRHEELQKSIVCEYCPKKFNYKFDMIRHVKAVHTEATHKCHHCGKGFVRRDHLQLHENKHRRKLNNDAAELLLPKNKKKQGKKVDALRDSWEGMEQRETVTK